LTLRRPVVIGQKARSAIMLQESTMLSETRETIGDLQRRLMALRGHL